MDVTTDRCWLLRRDPVTVYHSGDLGDIVYAMLFCREVFESIHLVLGPERRFRVKTEITPKLFQFLYPLYAEQPWIQSVRQAPFAPPHAVNLNEFRSTFFDRSKRRSSRNFEVYAEHFGTPALPEDTPWLEVTPKPVPSHPVVIARSFRYQNLQFPWKAVAAKYRNQLLFVGLQEEYDTWVHVNGRVARYYPVANALELASVIAGAKLFIGNQSFPMALALSLGVPLIQEVSVTTPDCIFKRSNATFWTHGPLALPDISCDSYPQSQTKTEFLSLDRCRMQPALAIL